MESGRLPLFIRLQLGARGMLGRPPLGRPKMPLRGFLMELAVAVARTDERELSCDDCLQELDQLVEWAARGRDPDALMPLVMAHLHRCDDCYQEYAALLRIVRAERSRREAG